MKHTWKAALAAVALLGTTQVSKADLNISGATGLVLNPTAQIVAKDQPQIQANYYDFGSEFDDKFYGVFGAIQAADNLEISGGLNKYTSDWEPWEDTGFALGAKYQLFNQSEKGFDLAVGAGYDRGLQRNVNGYVAATKAFGSSANRAPIAGTLGLRYDRFKDGEGFRSSKASVFAGVQIPVTRNGEFSVLGEIQSKNIEDDFSEGDGAKFPFALGLRYAPGDQAFSVTAGVQRHGLNSPWENSAKLFVQVGYKFGR